MLQNRIDHQQANAIVSELATERQYKILNELDAREEMVAARREEQRLHILRNLMFRR
jgi:hypothetical protein